MHDSTIPELLVVQQRDRHRLVAGELVVGVVAHERAVRDPPAQRRLDARQPPVEARGGLLDVVAQRLEGLLHRRGVRHQVALAALAQHHALGACAGAAR